MKKRKTAIIVYILAVLLLIGVVYYVTLPPLSIYSGSFWSFFLFLDAVVFVSYLVIGALSGKLFGHIVRMPSGAPDLRSAVDEGAVKKSKFVKIQFFFTLAVFAFLLIGTLVGSVVFRAKTYSSRIDVQERNFSETIAETEYVTDIALMDSASARIIGARTLGTLSDLVSQYEVAYDYTQIAIREGDVSHPYKVAPLEYASFFKWLTNRDGIPGYVQVDAVEFNAKFVRLDNKFIRYSPSAYFGENLLRALRFRYPTKIFGNICFEVDDEGHPYWVASTMKPHAGLFGAMDVDTVILMDAVTGESTEYQPASSPEWVDIVYYGDLVCRKYDWYGLYSGGYLNSRFSQTNCVVTTNDFGYKIIGNDVYIFTGVTSTSGDQANIGFILVNSRTGEYLYFAVPGAEEYSAMAAAQGAVQQFGYKASFPSLINVGGEATYIMVLKDASGIVKMYAMVNVENYNIVVTSDTQEEVFQKYKSALFQSGTKIETDALLSETVTVDEIQYITTGGETIVYLKTPAGIYRMVFDESILFVEEGDTVTVTYPVKVTDGVTPITSLQP